MSQLALLIDLDGTIADTLPVCLAAFRSTFARHTRITYSNEEIQRHFGLNEEGIFRRMAPDCWEACLPTYLDEYVRAHAACPAPFPGICELLRSARSRGIRLGMVTGKSQASTDASLRYLGLAPLFEVVRTGSALGNNKREKIEESLLAFGVAPARAVYVGDTPSDMRAARAAGVTALAAAWAITADPRALAAEHPDAQFDTVLELETWIEVWASLKR